MRLNRKTPAIRSGKSQALAHYKVCSSAATSPAPATMTESPYHQPSIRIYNGHDHSSAYKSQGNKCQNEKRHVPETAVPDFVGIVV